MTTHPFWWGNPDTGRRLDKLRDYYESPQRDKWTEDRLRKEFAGFVSLILEDESSGLTGVNDFHARLELLFKAMNSDHKQREDAIKRLIRAAIFHYEDDLVIQREIKDYCVKNNCWEEHRNSLVRTLLLEAANHLQREAKELLQQ